MSCGNPHATPCSQVLLRIHEYLDDEVEATFVEAIVTHLDECPPCATQVHVERTVRALVVRSCGSTAAPEALRVQIIERIRANRLGEGS